MPSVDRQALSYGISMGSNVERNRVCGQAECQKNYGPVSTLRETKYVPSLSIPENLQGGVQLQYFKF